MAPRKMGVLRRATVASVAALALAAGAFAVALITAADSHSTDHKLLLGALIAMIVVIVTIAVGIIAGVRRGLLRPFRELNKAVAAVADGRFGTRIPAVGPAELADLSRGIELMRTRLLAALDEREQAQESLRSLFDLAPDAMVAVAGDGTIMMANAQAIQLYGYTAGELIGRPVTTLLPEEWRSSMATASAGYPRPAVTAGRPGDQVGRAAPGRYHVSGRGQAELAAHRPGNVDRRRDQGRLRTAGDGSRGVNACVPPRSRIASSSGCSSRCGLKASASSSAVSRMISTTCST